MPTGPRTPTTPLPKWSNRQSKTRAAAPRSGFSAGRGGGIVSGGRYLCHLPPRHDQRHGRIPGHLFAGDGRCARWFIGRCRICALRIPRSPCALYIAYIHHCPLTLEGAHTRQTDWGACVNGGLNAGRHWPLWLTVWRWRGLVQKRAEHRLKMGLRAGAGVGLGTEQDLRLRLEIRVVLGRRPD